MASKRESVLPGEDHRTESGYRVAEGVLGLIGATPLVRLARVSDAAGATV